MKIFNSCYSAIRHTPKRVKRQVVLGIALLIIASLVCLLSYYGYLGTGFASTTKFQVGILITGVVVAFVTFYPVIKSIKHEIESRKIVIHPEDIIETTHFGDGGDPFKGKKQLIFSRVTGLPIEEI